MYAHKLLRPQSSYVKYRGNTGQIDRRDTVINILAKNPGLIGARIAEKIFNKDLLPCSYSDIYKLLKDFCREGVLVRNGNLYYLTADAISHDMAVTIQTAKSLDDIGVNLQTARFLSSGIIMAGESFAAEQKGENFNIDETAATGVASAPESKVQASEDEIDAQISANTADIIALQNLEIENPFNEMTDSVRESLIAEADKLIEQSYIDEAKAVRVKLAEQIEKAKSDAFKSIKAVSDLVGKKVEINTGKFNGQVIGNVLEIRPSGMTFLITYSTDPSIEFGTVMTVEYVNGLSYKIVFDFDQN